MISTWRPFAGVTVKTELRPFGEWHVHIHRIISDRELYAAEGGVPSPRRLRRKRRLRAARANAGGNLRNGRAAVIAPWA